MAIDLYMRYFLHFHVQIYNGKQHENCALFKKKKNNYNKYLVKNEV